MPDLVGVEILAGEVVELYESQGGWLHELKRGSLGQKRGNSWA